MNSMNFQRIIFPDEIICRILRFLSIWDVVRLRAVSKRFCAITYDPSIWRALYANAPFPRPPGPYPSQSARWLEHTLVKSAQLAQKWTTQEIQYHENKDISDSFKVPMESYRIINGSWLLYFNSPDQFVLQDIETNFRQILWKSDSGIVARSWGACSLMSGAELLVYILFQEPTSNIKKLMEFRVDVHSGQVQGCTPFIIPETTRDSAYYLAFSGQATLLYLSLPGSELIFDTRTRVFYKVPQFSTELEDATLWEARTRQILLTNTHVVALTNTYIRGSHPFKTLVQAFVLPSDPPLDIDDIRWLQLSHEDIIQGMLCDVFLIRNAVVDCSTGSTSLRYLYRRCSSRPSVRDRNA